MSAQITDLRCENESEPLGIDEKSPRFSWRIECPERWDGGGSQQHQMNNVIPEWVCSSLAGISPAAPSFGGITIKPTCATTYVPEAVSCSLETIRGVVVSNWTRSAGGYTLNVTVPPNCSALVYISTFGQSGVAIREGGTTVWNNGSVSGTAEGARFDRVEGAYPSANNYVVFNAGSGSYTFTTPQGTGVVTGAKNSAGPVGQQVLLFSMDGRLVKSYTITGIGTHRVTRDLPSRTQGIYIMTSRPIGSKRHQAGTTKKMLLQ